MSEDTSSWLTSKPVASFLRLRRDNDLKVRVNGILVPVEDVYYDQHADSIVLELFHGEDYKMALMTDPVPEPKSP